MKVILTAILSIVVFLAVYVGVMLFTSWLTVSLFSIWGIGLPFIKVFQSLILISVIYSLLFSTSKRVTE